MLVEVAREGHHDSKIFFVVGLGFPGAVEVVGLDVESFPVGACS